MRVYVLPGVNTAAFAVMVLWGIPILASIRVARRNGRRAGRWAVACAILPLSIIALLLLPAVETTGSAQDDDSISKHRRLDAIFGSIAAILSSTVILIVAWGFVTDPARGLPRCDSDLARTTLSSAERGRLGYSVYVDLTDLGGAPDGVRHCSARLQNAAGETVALYYDMFKDAEGALMMGVTDVGPPEQVP